jgi:drug/metabolite transporter (DMT)-like permease
MSAADLGRLVLLAAVWGLAFVFIRVAVMPLGPVALVALRQVIAGLALALYIHSLGLSLDVRGRWRVYLPIALLNSAVPFVLIAAAQRELAASYTVILVSTTPLFSALIAAVALNDPLTLRKATGLGLGIAGVALLIGWNPTALDLPPLWAIAAVLAAALLYAVAGVYTRMVAHGIPPIATAAGSQLGAAFLVLPFVAAVPPGAMPTPLEWLNVLAPRLPPRRLRSSSTSSSFATSGQSKRPPSTSSRHLRSGRGCAAAQRRSPPTWWRARR